MATSKITDLTAYTDPVSTDVLPIVDVTSDVTKKVSIANVMKNASLGTAALPGISFDGDPNTGVYSPGADQVAIATNGTARLNIDASGTVNVPGALTKGGNNVVTVGDTGTVTSAMIADGTILNADINASAAIAGTKISPDFGSQNTTTTGTSTAASFIPTSSTAPTNGVYLPAANNVAISTNGSGRLFVDSSGRVGVGASPSARFEVSTTAGTEARITSTVDNNADLTFYTNSVQRGIVEGNSLGMLLGTTGALPTTFITNNAERMRLDSSGRLGLGTSSPSWLLSLRKDSSSGGAGDYPVVQINNADADGYAALYLNDSTAQAGLETRRTTGHLGMYAGGSEKARIDSSGRLGIGTATPGSPLAIESNAGNQVKITYPSVASYYLNATSGGDFAINKDGTERARIDSSGRLLVGTSTASTADSSANPLLQVVGRVVAKSDATYSSTAAYGFAFRNSTNLYNMVWGGYDNTADLGFIQATYEGTAHKPFVVNPNGGEVRIGGITDQGAYNLQCQGTGVWGAGAYVNGSDERLKENIQDLGPALDVVKALRPVTFQYKEEYSRDQSVQPGFIAQELQQALANQAYLEGIVQVGPVHLNVAYQGLIAVLVKAVQELEAKVAALEGV